MDKKDVEILCKLLGDVISKAVPIIVDAITNYSKEDSKKNGLNSFNIMEGY